MDTLPRWAAVAAAVRARGDGLRRLGMLAFVLLIPFLWWVPARLHQWHPKIEPGNLWRLTAYVGAGVGVLCWAGMVLVWRREGSRALRFCLAFFALCAGTLIFRKYIESIYPWATRRYLDLVPPLAALGAAVTIETIGDWRLWRRWAGPGLAVGLVALASVPLAPRFHAAWANTEYDGAGAALARVAAAVPEGAVVVSDHFLWGMPLQCVYGKQVLVAVCPKSVAPDVFYGRALRAAAPAAAGRLMLLTSAGDEGIGPGTPATLRATLLLDQPWETREAVHNRHPNPFYLKPRTYRFRLYDIRMTDPATPAHAGMPAGRLDSPPAGGIMPP
jgi:hypothetical protein